MATNGARPAAVPSFRTMESWKPSRNWNQPIMPAPKPKRPAQSVASRGASPLLFGEFPMQLCAFVFTFRQSETETATAQPTRCEAVFCVSWCFEDDHTHQEQADQVLEGSDQSSRQSWMFFRGLKELFGLNCPVSQNHSCFMEAQHWPCDSATANR